jgi:hypothetical protein
MGADQDHKTGQLQAISKLTFQSDHSVGAGQWPRAVSEPHDGRAMRLA